MYESAGPLWFELGSERFIATKWFSDSLLSYLGCPTVSTALRPVTGSAQSEEFNKTYTDARGQKRGFQLREQMANQALGLASLGHASILRICVVLG